MRQETGFSIIEQLANWRHLEECLLYEVRWTNGLYSADLKFNYVWNSDGSVRQNILEEPLIVVIRLTGIHHLSFAGALTEAMIRHPENINWGLSEVARVDARQDANLQVSVAWESGRQLDVACASGSLVEL